MKRGNSIPNLRFGMLILFCVGFVSWTKGQIESQEPRAVGRARLGTGTTLQSMPEIDTRTLQSLMATPLEEPINPEKYIVGPNDMFQIGIWGGANVTYPAFVSPEGSIIIPTVGEVIVAGQTLAEAKRMILDRIRKSYRLAEVTVTLVAPRRFVVTVLGAVRVPGPYIVSSAYRVDKAISLANSPTEGANPATPLPDFSRRRVKLQRRGSDQLVDIERFYALRDDADNPFLMEGDIIVVPHRNFNQGSVSIYGAVNAPGQFEYREQDSLMTLVRLAHGLTENADPSKVEITQLSQDGRTANVREVNLTDILARTAGDIPLRPNDRVVIRERVNKQRDYKVHVRGEVVYPGTYPITADSTRLTEIIRRAGGFTKSAYLPAAEVVRRQVTAEGEQVDFGHEAQLNFRMNDQIVTPEERQYYDLESHLRRGTVAVDFVRLFEKNEKSQDIVLADGDVISIPSSYKTVYIYGQVSRPGFVAYQQGADVRYYISQAGGFGDEAESGNVRVIKGKTREWVHPSDTTIEPGDYIWVPKVTKYPFSYYMNIASQAASLVSVVLSMTLIVLQLTQN
ncbi:MAG TPA: SLBB domain-containing protein [Bacteroidota bacterium]|nr:SLBB domain-containing protein [Bacteroidota bacterium]